jgi:hypothetical protein
VPVARIVLGVGETVGQPRLDPEYVPPSVFLPSSPRLFEIVRNIVDQVGASHKELLGQINRGNLSVETMHGHQFEQVLRLRTLSRFAARLPALIRASHVTPFAWYLELRELLGELQALKLGQESFEVAEYDHENLFHTFTELSEKVRAVLRTAVTAAFLKVELRKDPQSYAAALTEEQFTKPSTFPRGQDSRDYGAVASSCRMATEFMPKSMANKAFGVRRAEENFRRASCPTSRACTTSSSCAKERARVTASSKKRDKRGLAPSTRPVIFR